MEVLQALELLFLCHAADGNKKGEKGTCKIERDKDKEADRGEWDKTRSIREIRLSPGCFTACCVTTEYVIPSTTALILLI